MAGNRALSLTECVHFQTKEKMMTEETSGVRMGWEKSHQKFMLQKEHNSGESDETEEGENVNVKDYLDELHSAMLGKEQFNEIIALCCSQCSS